MGGGFAVDNATLVRFFSLHFILPFIIAGIAGVHLLFLHQTGSNNPIGLNSNYDKISFHSYFTSKDLFGFFILFFLLTIICFFIAYAILRAIPNKLGGVIALAFSILILFICPFMYVRKFLGFAFYPINK